MDRLESALGVDSVLKVNVMSRVGAEVAQKHSVRGVPTLIVFDGTGAAVYSQVGRIDDKGVLARLKQ